ncbi:MAG: hypothetical protein WD512_15620, partial [Candidatus Paceibacterota bacterium]
YEYFNAFYFVVLHNSQWGTKGLESNIKNMVLYGDFPNRSYAALHDRISRNFNKGELEDCSSYGTDLIFEINDKLVVPVLNDSIVDCIDRKRKEIGLERIELFINKRIKQFSIDSLGVYNIGLNYSWGRVPVQMYDRMINSYKKNYSNIKIYERTYSRGDN